ncbi:unnamed protein product, partial [marine sediment metagenome]
HAEQKAFSHLGHLKHIKESRPGLIVAVIGCMAQRLADKLFEHKAVDIVCGPTQIPQIANLLKKAMDGNTNVLAVTKKISKAANDRETNSALDNFESAYAAGGRRIPNQAFVRVMRGCNNFCSYCIVPYVRGPEINRPPKAIISQIKRLADQGVKLITLLGQAVNSYKYAAGDKTYCLADLLEMAGEVDGVEWIKFITSYPAQEFFREILQVIADLPKVCNYLHMPAQSGSEKILKAMNRKYTAGQYLNLLEQARAIVPAIAVAGDFIVGFPDETEQDFQDTLRLAERARYKNCFVFKYSPRLGTAAEKRLQDTVPQEVKRARNYELLALQEKISDELSRQFLGRTVEVMVEGLSKKSHLSTCGQKGYPQLAGRTNTDWIVVFNGPADLAGQFVKVKITKTSPLTLFGEQA